MLRFVFTVKARHNFIVIIFWKFSESGPCSIRFFSSRKKTSGDVIIQDGGQESVLCGGKTRKKENQKGNLWVSNQNNKVQRILLLPTTPVKLHNFIFFMDSGRDINQVNKMYRHMRKKLE